MSGHPRDAPPSDAKIIEERSIDHARPMRVVVVGSGLSGIIASIRLRQRVPNLDLCIYEKNDDVGGTWLENRYPGCACDIPAHTYQASFEPNKEWSSFYAAAPEIHKYWKRVVDKYGCMEYVKLRSQVIGAVWDEEEGKWRLKVQNTASDAVHSDQCHVLISATGSLNNWQWPSIPGLHDFKGKLMHSASWDEDYDYTGKKAAVIGNGSSGIQIVPGMLPNVSHLDHYVRGRTWVSPTFARDEIDKRGVELENFSFTPEEIKSFKKDHQTYQKFRKGRIHNQGLIPADHPEIELELQSIHPATMLGTPEQIQGQEIFYQNMERRLAKDPKLLDDIVPSFPPACRRLTPGPGYLEALTDEKVDMITSPIERVDKTGIVTADGKHRPIDVLVCATGFDTMCKPRFPITGRNGATMSNRWKEFPVTYMSLAVDDFPNYFICLGPNAGLGGGNLLLLIEKEIDYFTECVTKMQRDHVKTMSARADATQRFSRHCEQYFKRTVFGSECRSWYKQGTSDGRVTALWPGSSLHAMKALSHPRWEDFEYEYINDNPNGWLGDGWTENEKNKVVNVDYLDDDRIDFPVSVARDSAKAAVNGSIAVN